MKTLSELAWTQLWQVTAVAIIIGLLTRVFCRRRPHLAYLLWLVVVVKCLTPPLWSSTTGVFSWATRVSTSYVSLETTPITHTEIDRSLPTMPAAPIPEPVPGAEHDATASATEMKPDLVNPSGAAPINSAGLTQGPQRAETILLGIWLAGATGYAVFVFFTIIRLRRRFLASRMPAAAPLVALTNDLARRLGVRRRVSLWLSREPLGPLTFVWFRPCIVIPEALAAHRSGNELEPLLAHELIHVRRGDVLIGMLQVAVQCLWWFHPLVWWANRRIVCECERCCDEEVVAGLACRPVSYARTLVEVLEMKRQLRWPATLPGARRFEITRQRLERIMVDNGRFQKRTPRCYGLVAVAAALVLIPGAALHQSKGAGAAELLEQSSGAQDQKASAAAIMQAVYDSFAWIDKARTFRIRTKLTLTNTPEELRWQDTHPQPYSYGKPNPRSFVFETEWAWNERAVLNLDHSYREGEAGFYRGSKLWDGTVAIASSESEKQSKQYSLHHKLSRFFSDHDVSYMAQLPWGSGGAHNFWWLPTDVTKHRETFRIAPQDFELVGEERVNDRKCHVLESKAGHWRVYIDMDDGRLYRRTCLFYSATDPQYLTMLQKVGGPAIKTRLHWGPWLARLEPEQARGMQREFDIATFALARPRFHQYFDDYREVAPGCWMPFKQTMDGFNMDAPEMFLASRSEQTVSEVAVNQPLDDDQFRIELTEGSKVDDMRYDPFIRYTYRMDQTEAERVALCEAAKEKKATDDERQYGVIKFRLGNVPPALPQTGWLDGKAVSWEQLQGKTVVIHFWDGKHGGPPTELPTLAFWHEDTERGIFVIGIHPPTDDLAAVRKNMEKSCATFPVLIDAPSNKEGGTGLMHDWFGSSGWVPTVLINKRGHVAGYGQILFGDIPDQLRRLAAEKE